MSERFIAIVVFLGCIYGAVWSVLTQHADLLPVFFFLIVISIWTVLVLWDQPEFGERE